MVEEGFSLLSWVSRQRIYLKYIIYANVLVSYCLSTGVDLMVPMIVILCGSSLNDGSSSYVMV